MTGDELLFVPTASDDAESYCRAVREAYEGLGCSVSVLRLVENPDDSETIQRKIDAADTVYLSSAREFPRFSAGVNRVRWVGRPKVPSAETEGLSAPRPDGGVATLNTQVPPSPENPSGTVSGGRQNRHSDCGLGIGVTGAWHFQRLSLLEASSPNPADRSPDPWETSPFTARRMSCRSGDTDSMLDVWEAHQVDDRLRSAGRAGTLLTGLSAGANCWFAGSYGDSASSDNRLQSGRRTPCSPIPLHTARRRVRSFGHVRRVRPRTGGRWRCYRKRSSLRSSNRHR